VSQPVVRPDPSLRRFLALLAVAMVLIRTVALMMGPLLISLSVAFHTSMTAAGHLAAAINGSWAVTALLAGPVSDAFGRRRVGLTGLAVMAASLLASSLAWDYGSLLVCRLLTGVGAAMVPPNAMAAIADFYPAARRGRPIGLVISAGFLGPVLAIPLVVVLAQVGAGGCPSLSWGAAAPCWRGWRPGAGPATTAPHGSRWPSVPA
jgi:predicted MFS family arabinose efflux permease